MCLRCFIYTYPDQKVSKHYKIKEQHVADFIQQKYADYDMTFDKQIEGGCSRRRPDILMELGTHTIIVEVDENQHESYDTTCEIARINELFTDLADRPIVLMRFNPDAYKVGEIKHQSSFKVHGRTGVPMIRDTTEWNSRLNALDQVISRWTSEIPDELITIENLFFDS